VGHVAGSCARHDGVLSQELASDTTHVRRLEARLRAGLQGALQVCALQGACFAGAAIRDSNLYYLVFV
jgi:hypothetical protein